MHDDDGDATSFHASASAYLTRMSGFSQMSYHEKKTADVTGQMEQGRI